jgi:phospholipid/cholesterol/gamma-HCH transport system substrate-binding protein
MSKELATKVGLFVVLGSAALGGVILFFGEIPILKGERLYYYAYFKNAAGLSIGADVRVAGVKAGKVKDIVFENGQVKVIIELDKPIPIYKDATAKIQSLSLLGDKYLEIDPGNPELGKLPPNSKINYTQPPVDTSRLIAKLTETSQEIGKVASNLAKIVEENRRNINLLLENLAQLSKNLNHLVRDNRENLDETLKNVAKLTKQLEKSLPHLTKNYSDLAKNLNKLVKENSPYVKGTLKNLDQLTEALNKKLPQLVENINKASQALAENKQSIHKTLKNLAEITEKIKRGEGTLGKLINDKQLYVHLTKATKTLGKAGEVLGKTSLHIEAWGEYIGTGDGKAGVNLMLQPDEKKYYLLGVVGDSLGKVTKKTYYENGHPREVTEKEFKPEINLEYARIIPDRWLHPGSSFVFRAGIIESTGGLGLDYVYNEKLMLTFNIWDFGREDRPNEDLKPNTELGIRYMVYGPAFIKFGGYDLLNEEYRTVFVGGGFSFTDNDLKYLLGGLKVPTF